VATAAAIARYAGSLRRRDRTASITQMVIVGAVFLYFVTDGLLWLEGYVRN
jgi:hypothetical protein